MNRSVCASILALLALAGAQHLYAGCVDQECTITNSSTNIVNHLPIGQSYVPSESEHLGIDLRLMSSLDAIHSPVTLVLHEDTLAGPLVPGATATVTPNSGNWEEWIPFAFPWPVPLTPGSMYVVEILTSTHNLGWDGDFLGNPYPQGHGFINGEDWGGDFNFRTWVSCTETMMAWISCDPTSGVLPFSTHMEVYLRNLYAGPVRRYAARIDIALGGGGSFSNWRSGYMNIQAGDYFDTVWNQNLPHAAGLHGSNVFRLLAEDVTPSPYNQPPYLPSGDTAMASCTVEGL
jgi:hypothetical protein